MEAVPPTSLKSNSGIQLHTDGPVLVDVDGVDGPARGAVSLFDAPASMNRSCLVRSIRSWFMERVIIDPPVDQL